MNILIGLGSGLVLFLCLLIALCIGYKLGSKEHKVVEPKATEKELQEHKRRMEGMQNILNYSIEKAMEVKHE